MLSNFAVETGSSSIQGPMSHALSYQVWFKVGIISLSDPAGEASTAVPTLVWTAAHAVSKFYKSFGAKCCCVFGQSERNFHCRSLSLNS